jgi:hypothetical protein
MPRRFRRSSRRSFGRPLKTVSYNNQTVHAYEHCLVPHGTVPCPWFQLIHNVAVGDMKVKNFTLKMATTDLQCPLAFALVYLPFTVAAEGQNLYVGDHTIAAQLYSPAQNVILSGILPAAAGTPQSFHTRLARNMEPGDYILLLVKPIVVFPDDDWQYGIDIILNYVNTMQ